MPPYSCTCERRFMPAGDTRTFLPLAAKCISTCALLSSGRLSRKNSPVFAGRGQLMVSVVSNRLAAVNGEDQWPYGITGKSGIGITFLILYNKSKKFPQHGAAKKPCPCDQGLVPSSLSQNEACQQPLSHP